MRANTRHPRLLDAACRVYGVAIRLYPTEFKRAFGHELIITFRNQLEDVLDSGSIVEWAGFAVLIAVDWVRTSATRLTQPTSRDSVSLLGLGDDLAYGGIDRVTVDVSFVFAALGVVLAIIGWYAFFVILPKAYF